MSRAKRRAFLALALLVPAPSVGAYCAMVLYPNAALGGSIFAASKLWLALFPFIWMKFVDKETFGLSEARRGGFAFGAASGLVLGCLIAAAYTVLGRYLIDERRIAQKAAEMGLSDPLLYLGGASYWVLINSVLEEYVWRWFCVAQCERLFSSRLAVVASALFFTLHHVVALHVYASPSAAAFGAACVFSAGLVWSAMYLRYRSIWPGYISHAIADLAIFSIGARIIFSPR